MTGRRWFWLGLAAGTPLMAIGVWGIFRDAAVTSPFNFALWFIGGNLVHEADLYSLMFSTDDAREGLSAFVEKRQASFVGK